MEVEIVIDQAIRNHDSRRIVAERVDCEFWAKYSANLIFWAKIQLRVLLTLVLVVQVQHLIPQVIVVVVVMRAHERSVQDQQLVLILIQESFHF